MKHSVYSIRLYGRSNIIPMHYWGYERYKENQHIITHLRVTTVFLCLLTMCINSCSLSLIFSRKNQFLFDPLPSNGGILRWENQIKRKWYHIWKRRRFLHYFLRCAHPVFLLSDRNWCSEIKKTTKKRKRGKDKKKRQRRKLTKKRDWQGLEMLSYFTLLAERQIIQM